jgi:hypothetical protein
MKKLLNVGKTILTSEIDQSTVDSKKVQHWLSRNRQIHCPEPCLPKILKPPRAFAAHTIALRIDGFWSEGLDDARGNRHSRTRTLIEASDNNDPER